MGKAVEVVEDVVGGVVDVVEDVVSGVVDGVTRVVDIVLDVAEKATSVTIDVVAGWCPDCAKFLSNVNDGFYTDLKGANKASRDGHWKEFVHHMVGATMTVVYIVAFAIGVITGNAWLMAAAIVALDGQRNNGELTAKVVDIAGKIETMMTGTEIIRRNAEYITAALIIVASIYAGQVGFGFLAEISGVASLVKSAEWITKVKAMMEIGLGINSVYEAYREFQYWQDYYSNMMAQYEKWLENIEKVRQSLNDAFVEMMGDVEMFMGSFPAGIKYTESGAGGRYFSPSAVYDPNATMLSYYNEKDRYMDAIATNFDDFDFINIYDKNTIAKTNSIF